MLICWTSDRNRTRDAFHFDLDLRPLSDLQFSHDIQDYVDICS